jgi:hypothetical protein
MKKWISLIICFVVLFVISTSSIGTIIGTKNKIQGGKGDGESEKIYTQKQIVDLFSSAERIVNIVDLFSSAERIVNKDLVTEYESVTLEEIYDYEFSYVKDGLSIYMYEKSNTTIYLNENELYAVGSGTMIQKYREKYRGGVENLNEKINLDFKMYYNSDTNKFLIYYSNLFDSNSNQDSTFMLNKWIEFDDHNSVSAVTSFLYDHNKMFKEMKYYFDQNIETSFNHLDDIYNLKPDYFIEFFCKIFESDLEDMKDINGDFSINLKNQEEPKVNIVSNYENDYTMEDFSFNCNFRDINNSVINFYLAENSVFY